MKKQILPGFLLLTSCKITCSQENAEGCKDHPKFDRMPKQGLRWEIMIPDFNWL
jgi:hypothetical protein